MKDIGSRLREMRIKNGLTQDELAEKLHCGAKAISRYESDENLSKVYDFIRVCECLGDINYIITGKKSNNGKEITPEEKKILSAYKNLTDSDRRVVDFIFKTSKREKIKPIIKYESIVTDDIKALPLVEQKASAGIGDPTHQWSNEADKIAFPLNEVIVDGFSMEPTFFNGQIVFINAEKECNDSDFGIFQVITPEKTDIYCKQLKYDKFGRRYLHSVSNRADDPEFTEDEETILECIGKIIVL